MPRGIGKTSPQYIDIVLFFHFIVFQEYWVLTESKIPLKRVLGGIRIVALSISSHEQAQKKVVGSLIF